MPGSDSTQMRPPWRFTVHVNHHEQISKIAEAQSHKAWLFHGIGIFTGQGEFVLQYCNCLSETDPVSA